MSLMYSFNQLNIWNILHLIAMIRALTGKHLVCGINTKKDKKQITKA